MDFIVSVKQNPAYFKNTSRFNPSAYFDGYWTFGVSKFHYNCPAP